MKISEVIKANKEIRILNIVKFNKWDNVEISNEFIKMLDYDMSYIRYNVEMNMTKKEISNYYIEYAQSLENENNFNKLIKALKETYIKNIDKKTLLKLQGLEDYFNNWEEVRVFILNSVLPEIKALNIQ